MEFITPRHVLRRALPILLFSPALVVAADAPATQPGVQTVADRKDVSPADIDQTLSDQWLTADLARGQSLNAWNVPVTAAEPSTVILGTSSEFQFCLVLSGEVTCEEKTADAGHVIFWSLQPGSEARGMEFSGRDLQQSLLAVGRKDLADKLDSFTSSQNTRRFWGLVRPINVNIGAPLRANIDLARKSYLAQPEVTRLRRAAQSTGQLPALTAAAVLEHLKAQQTEELSQLLSPEAFVEPAKRNELSQARHAVAAALIAQPWTKTIDPATLKPTTTPLRYTFSAGAEHFLMTLKPFDEMVYVSSIELEKR